MFEVKITSDWTLDAEPHYRLVIEGTSYGVSVQGNARKNDVAVTVPPLGRLLGEGRHSARLETIIGNKILVPLKFGVVVKQSLKAEARVVSCSPANSEEQNVVAARLSKKSPTLSERFDKKA